jgi:hypothetical protein
MGEIRDAHLGRKKRQYTREEGKSAAKHFEEKQEMTNACK